jgi:hypothetical protein
VALTFLQILALWAGWTYNNLTLFSGYYYRRTFMETTTPRKVWDTPKVFVLGAEGTQAYDIKGTNEVNYGHTTITLGGGTKVQSVNLVTGYQS